MKRKELLVIGAWMAISCSGARGPEQGATNEPQLRAECFVLMPDRCPPEPPPEEPTE